MYQVLRTHQTPVRQTREKSSYDFCLCAGCNVLVVAHWKRFTQDISQWLEDLATHSCVSTIQYD